MTLVQLGPVRFDSRTGPPCHDCSAKCCKYFAGDNPDDLHFETAGAFDRWSKIELARREDRLARRRSGNQRAIA